MAGEKRTADVIDVTSPSIENMCNSAAPATVPRGIDRCEARPPVPMLSCSQGGDGGVATKPMMSRI
jgi:hypothetical protein